MNLPREANGLEGVRTSIEKGTYSHLWGWGVRPPFFRLNPPMRSLDIKEIMLILLKRLTPLSFSL